MDRLKVINSLIFGSIVLCLGACGGSGGGESDTPLIDSQPQVQVDDPVNHKIEHPNNFIATLAVDTIRYTWDMNEAYVYTLYIAHEAEIDPDNYSVLDGAIMISDVRSPYEYTRVDLGKPYYAIVTAASNAIESDPSEVLFVAAFKEGSLNDTGIALSKALSGNLSQCSQSHLLEDCAVGRDAQAPDDSDGSLGFSFTKLDEQGQALADDAVQWHCLLDNVTGLIWEIKQEQQGLHAKDDRYMWSTNEALTDTTSQYTCWGYIPGRPATYCNAAAFVKRVNQQGLCGASDWRLPSVGELSSIVNYSKHNPAIDLSHFPNTVNKHYWAGQAFVKNSGFAWNVGFDFGHAHTNDIGIERELDGYIRLVRPAPNTALTLAAN